MEENFEKQAEELDIKDAPEQVLPTVRKGDSKRVVNTPSITTKLYWFLPILILYAVAELSSLVMDWLDLANKLLWFCSSFLVWMLIATYLERRKSKKKAVLDGKELIIILVVLFLLPLIIYAILKGFGIDKLVTF